MICMQHLGLLGNESVQMLSSSGLLLAKPAQPQSGIPTLPSLDCIMMPAATNDVGDTLAIRPSAPTAMICLPHARVEVIFHDTCGLWASFFLASSESICNWKSICAQTGHRFGSARLIDIAYCFLCDGPLSNHVQLHVYAVVCGWPVMPIEFNCFPIGLVRAASRRKQSLVNHDNGDQRAQGAWLNVMHTLSACVERSGPGSLMSHDP